MSSPTAPLVALDLVGVFVFALSGGLAAARARLDIFGIVVVATVTAIGGGIVRDTLIGTSPPVALQQWPYLAVPAGAAVVVFLWQRHVQRARRLVLVLDAAGLGLFTVTGTRAALDAGLGAAGACAVGVLSGIGGGVIRDVLLREIPLVLHREIYAVAAVVGAVLVCVGDGIHHLDTVWQVSSAIVVFAIRLIAVRRHWSAPRAPFLEDQAGA